MILEHKRPVNREYNIYVSFRALSLCLLFPALAPTRRVPVIHHHVYELPLNLRKPPDRPGLILVVSAVGSQIMHLESPTLTDLSKTLIRDSSLFGVMLTTPDADPLSPNPNSSESQTKLHARLTHTQMP